MKRFYIIAHPNYFKKSMGWDMKDKEVKYTEDKLVMFVATENVPETNIIEPYHCGLIDTDGSMLSSEMIYKPYINEIVK